MAGSTIGQNFTITTFGESHGKAIGVVMDGVQPKLKFDVDFIQKQLDRRKPGQSKLATARKETDKVEVLSGVLDGKTLGTPICLVIYNKDARSKDYSKIKDIFRPGHAGFTYIKKFGIRDYRGGGRSSGRETAARVAAGAFAMQMLLKEKVKIIAYTKQVANIKAEKINLKEIENNAVRCPDKNAAKKMGNLILKTMKQGDSVGGIVEAVVKNVTAGLGEPVFDKLEADIAKALMSIGSVKGVEFGLGFQAALLKGSQVNDQISKKGFLSNNAGGFLGGISTGQDIVVRVAVKPTASISKEQLTVDTRGKEHNIKVEGRHDPCICPRVVPVVESMLALVLYDHLLKQKALKNSN